MECSRSGQPAGFALKPSNEDTCQAWPPAASLLPGSVPRAWQPVWVCGTQTTAWPCLRAQCAPLTLTCRPQNSGRSPCRRPHGACALPAVCHGEDPPPMPKGCALRLVTSPQRWPLPGKLLVGEGPGPIFPHSCTDHMASDHSCALSHGCRQGYHRPSALPCSLLSKQQDGTPCRTASAPGGHLQPLRPVRTGDTAVAQGRLENSGSHVGPGSQAGSGGGR